MGFVSVSVEYRWRVSFKSTVRGDNVDPLHFLLGLASSDVNLFQLSFHCGWMIWGIGVGRKLLKCCGNCCDSERDAGLLSIEFVIWVLRIVGIPPANCWSFEYSSLIGLPNVLFPAKSNPQVSVVDLDKFDRSV